MSEWSLASSFISFFLTYIRDFQVLHPHRPCAPQETVTPPKVEKNAVITSVCVFLLFYEENQSAGRSSSEEQSPVRRSARRHRGPTSPAGSVRVVPAAGGRQVMGSRASCRNCLHCRFLYSCCKNLMNTTKTRPDGTMKPRRTGICGFFIVITC